MGIPSYFSYILRKHRQIIKAYQPMAVENFYLDSNSIVYDMVRQIEYGPNFESDLIQAVCKKIQEYLDLVRPKHALIAFDGVPPRAKMVQQRTRRYKGTMTDEEPSKWNTVQITPGTKFMSKLDSGIRAFFKKHPSVVVSGSDVPGEGEHKIYEMIRSRPHPGKTVIYGLDSDLIILSLSHSHLASIYLLREAPAFMLKDDRLQMLDIAMLATQIENIMGKGKLMDYIVITLLMGNDFMPKFPSLNLRTVGHDIVMKAYTATIGGDRLFDGQLNWTAFKRLIVELARQEPANFKTEHNRPRVGVQDSNNTPMFRRELELYINPNEVDWERRYYTTLFQSEKAPVFLNKACSAYYAMLNWNIHYYTTGCIDWSIYYPYMYPPLLADLAAHTVVLPEYSTGGPCTAAELLQYVLPSKFSHFSLSPIVIPEQNPTLVWAYCKFTWEAHVQF